MTTNKLDNLINEFSTDNLLSFFVDYKELRDFVPSTGSDRDISDLDSENFINGEKIGEIDYSVSEKLMVFAFKVNKPLTERSGKKAQFDQAKQVLRAFNNMYDGIFVFYDDQGNFRFSLIYVNFYGKRTQLSNYRRFTYYVSTQDGRTNKTFRQRMEQGDFSSIDGIKEAFSVEPVTKNFYKEISNWYDWALQSVTLPPDAEKEKNGREHAVIRLVTRMIFIWFMCEKGFIPKNLFEYKTIQNLLNDIDPKSSSYYHAILQNLFFSTLSTEIPERKFRKGDRKLNYYTTDYGVQGVLRFQKLFKDQARMPELFENIPFLNGGLFTCLDVRKSNENPDLQEIFIDGFTENKKNQVFVPNELFFGDERNIDLNAIYNTREQSYRVRGLLNIFSEFNFTIDENTPDDQDIALDPELLGHVFENLLARVNPETSEQARRETGSFYTPRHIVDFMVDEALAASLEATLQRQIPSANDIQSRIKSLLSYHSDAPVFSDAETEVLVKHIDQIKILDPACGSGAFPMGALNKLVYILGKLDPTNEIWKNLQYNKAFDAIERASYHEDSQLRSQRFEEIERVFNKDVDKDYGRKLYLIRNCIYGVDIQPIAAQISKLRFFISLIVDQSMDPTASDENFGIMPLPNLETKIVTANSLLSLSKGKPYSVPKPLLKLPKHLIDDVANLKRQLQIFLSVSAPTLREAAINDAKPHAIKINDGMKHVPEFEPIVVKELFESAKFASDLEKYLPVEIEPEAVQTQFGYDDIGTIQEQLRVIHELHFQASNTQLRETYEKKDNQLRKKLATLFIEAKKWGGQEADMTEKLLEWDPYDQNSVAPFFDPGWMFDIQDGIDIVIGNPPYIQLQSMASSNPEMQKNYREAGFKTHDSMGDIYGLFYELGYNLLKWNTGILSYITSNKWMRAGYGKKLRDFFSEFTDPLLIIDFSSQRVFESATVDVNILVFKKSKNYSKTKSSTINENCVTNLGDYINQNHHYLYYKVSETWVILDPIEKSIKEKIENIGTPLNEWPISINRGILTGYNKAFIISGQKRKELILKDPKSAEIIRPILRGRDIMRYGYIFSDNWVINTHNGVPSRNIMPINIDFYPAIKDHLDLFWERILRRTDQGITPYNLRSCTYLEEFSKQKIIYPNMSKYLPFFLDLNSFMTNQKCFIITGENLEYLVAFLNSKLFSFTYRNSFPELQGGTRELSKIFFEKIRVKKVQSQINLFLKNKIEVIQKKIMERESIVKENNELDEILISVYELNNREREMIWEFEII